MIRQAVIVAAGNGSRIQRFKEDVPKPLRKVCGLPLIKRAILTAKLAGIRDFIVVVGYKGDQIISALSQDSSLDVNLQFVTNPDWNKSNGLSLLAARPYIQGEFLLMMSDHLFDRGAVEKMVRMAASKDEVVLAIDKKLDAIFDLDDATKVKLVEDRIIRIGKDLKSYDAFDTGLFRMSPSIFEVLERTRREKGDASISDGVRFFAIQGQMGTCDVSDSFWQDVDTPEALVHAEKALFKSLRKPTDGWISQHINRPISTTISRFLVRTPLTANQVTFLVTLVGLLSGYFVSTGRYLDVAIGGILFNLASILDGCDGEISKLKLTSSKRGEWLDTLSDNLTYVVFLVGVSMGAHRIVHGSFEVFEAAFMLVGLAFLLVIMAIYLIYHANSGTLTVIQKDLNEEEKKESGGMFSWTGKVKFVMKRDFFALFFMVLCLLDQLPFVLHLSFLGINLTWIVILAYKRDLFKLGESKVNTAEPR